jgi:sialic acid synthase SpsE
MKKVCIIAEAGVNHNGSLNLAKKLIDAAVEAKAHAVKFQTFRVELGLSKVAKKSRHSGKKYRRFCGSILPLIKIWKDQFTRPALRRTS